VPVAKASPINPVPGGGALKIVGEGGNGNNEGESKDILPTQRARATGISIIITFYIRISMFDLHERQCML
jgi:hypothetical protein